MGSATNATKIKGIFVIAATAQLLSGCVGYIHNQPAVDLATAMDMKKQVSGINIDLNSNRLDNSAAANDSGPALIPITHYVADQLIANAKSNPQDELAVDDTLLATSFADINDLSQSSQLGRTVSEMIVSGMNQRGVNIKEIKLRDGGSFKIQKNGEFALSREVSQISHSLKARYVMTGTYSESFENVYFTARIIRLADNQIISSYDFVVKKSPDITAMLYMPEPSLKHPNILPYTPY